MVQLPHAYRGVLEGLGLAAASRRPRTAACDRRQFDRGNRREGKHAPQGRRSGDYFRRTGSPRPQRERKRERQSVGCPQQSGKGQTPDCPRKEIAPSIEIPSRAEAARRSESASPTEVAEATCPRASTSFQKRPSAIKMQAAASCRTALDTKVATSPTCD